MTHLTEYSNASAGTGLCMQPANGSLDRPTTWSALLFVRRTIGHQGSTRLAGSGRAVGKGGWTVPELAIHTEPQRQHSEIQQGRLGECGNIDIQGIRAQIGLSDWTLALKVTLGRGDQVLGELRPASYKRRMRQNTLRFQSIITLQCLGPCFGKCVGWRGTPCGYSRRP